MKKKILMIDDDEELCEEITEILTNEGYRVTTAFDGLKGNRLIRKYDYDLIILDIKMPGLSGFDILQGMKEKNREFKVIVLTGRPMSKNLLEEQNHNNREEQILGLANGIIGKPFDIEVLLGKVKELAS